MLKSVFIEKQLFCNQQKERGIKKNIPLFKQILVILLISYQEVTNYFSQFQQLKFKQLIIR
jgi:hypothetical protein